MVYAYLKSSHLSYYEETNSTLILIISCATAWAADFDKGLAAAEAGDYTTALSELKPFAEQGDANAHPHLEKPRNFL